MKPIIQKIKKFYYSLTPPEPYSSTNKLLNREWIAIAVICGSMLGLVIASKIPQYTVQYFELIALDQEEPLLDVAINGYVERPGVYQVPSQTKVQDLMDLAGVRPDGESKRRNKDSLLHQGQSVRVPKKKKKSKIPHSSIVQN